ncbi:pyrroline-5-carboxylate reductase [Streptococcus himalayensis]|uniref:Pyrroline-5-carboxylate reductase n=1 Tax=Streptococcus himalayensis TaxID=1888195 RepID=A0A917A6C0_9STRE|nr:pyrroline-5-carboxylate reductase [Streptococcus himalayensis]GGE28312.1 pyrroline-5-carboxylate reductase [Streptococcus himalayensis]
MTKIGFIGLGNMGGLLARIVSKNHDAEMILANRSPEKASTIAQEIGGQAVSNQEVFEQATVIFLGVKPAQFEALLAQYKSVLETRSSVLLISMAAGLSLAQLQDMVPSQHRFIRMMPNTPVAVGAGVITYALGKGTSQADEQLFQELFTGSAELILLEEKQLDAATALAGCGPAFVYPFIEALSDAGVQQGLPRAIALKMAAQTVLGSGKMVLDSHEHPAVLKDQVCSPGGSTIAGVASLEKTGFRGSVIEAVTEAYERTQELGQK